jgi:hypothetical protein
MTQTAYEDMAMPLMGLSVTDVDAGEGDGHVQVTLLVGKGTLTLGTKAALTFAVGDRDSGATMTFTRTVATINAARRGLTYLGNLDFAGAATLTIIANDLGNIGAGGALNVSGVAPFTPPTRVRGAVMPLACGAPGEYSLQTLGASVRDTNVA